MAGRLYLCYFYQMTGTKFFVIKSPYFKIIFLHIEVTSQMSSFQMNYPLSLWWKGCKYSNQKKERKKTLGTSLVSWLDKKKIGVAVECGKEEQKAVQYLLNTSVQMWHTNLLVFYWLKLVIWPSLYTRKATKATFLCAKEGKTHMGEHLWLLLQIRTLK